MRNILGARYELSLLLIAGSIVLLIAIAVGNSMGNHVLGAVTSRAAFSSTPVPIATPSAASDEQGDVLNRPHQILSVATDPAFPDPRITPEPPPPATPKPSPKPSPSPTFDDNAEPSPDDSDAPYTSPPLPVPLVSHDPDESPAPDDSASPRAGDSPAPRPPSRVYPSLPPSNGPTP
jgi:hypothetical protein